MNYYTCEVLGNTYLIRNSLKKLGFRFKSLSHSWIVEPITEKEKETFEKMRLFKDVYTELKFTKHGHNPYKSWERKNRLNSC